MVHLPRSFACHVKIMSTPEVVSTSLSKQLQRRRERPTSCVAPISRALGPAVVARGHCVRCIRAPVMVRRATKVQCLAMLGCGIAGYALSVEAHMDDPDYEAMCDIAAKFSCTEVFRSEYAHPLSHWGLVPPGHDLDIGLAAAGIMLYSAYFVAACLWDVMPARKPLFLTVASASAAFSCYLLYILKFVVRRPPRTLAMPPLPTRSAAHSNASLPAHLQHVLWRSWATSALCAPAFTSSTSRCSRSPSSNSSTRTTASRCARARRSLDLHVPGRHWWERHVVGR